MDQPPSSAHTMVYRLSVMCFHKKNMSWCISISNCRHSAVLLTRAYINSILHSPVVILSCTSASLNPRTLFKPLGFTLLSARNGAKRHHGWLFKDNDLPCCYYQSITSMWSHSSLFYNRCFRNAYRT